MRQRRGQRERGAQPGPNEPGAGGQPDTGPTTAPQPAIDAQFGPQPDSYNAQTQLPSDRFAGQRPDETYGQLPPPEPSTPLGGPASPAEQPRYRGPFEPLDESSNGPDSYPQSGSYPQPAPNSQPGPHSQPGSHSQPAGYGQPDSYGQQRSSQQPAGGMWLQGISPPPGYGQGQGQGQGSGQPGGYRQDPGSGQPGGYRQDPGSGQPGGYRQDQGSG